MSFKSIVLTLAICLGLAACGETTGEQVLIGGTVGAGAAAVAGESIAAGAAIGAAGNLLACESELADC